MLETNVGKSLAIITITRKHVGLEHIVTRQGTAMELNMRVSSFRRVRELDTATEERKRVGTMKTSHTILNTATTHIIAHEESNIQSITCIDVFSLPIDAAQVAELTKAYILWYRCEQDTHRHIA